MQAFVEAGGAVLTWSHVNALYLRLPAIVSLVHHHFLSTEDTADGMIETFVPNSELFPTGVETTKLLIYLTLHILGVYSARPLLGINLSSKLMSRLRFDLSGDWHNKPLEWNGHRTHSASLPQAHCLPLRGMLDLTKKILAAPQLQPSAQFVANFK